MRKSTIDLLEIESMELSRLYFVLETLPSSVSRELEECVRDARRVNLVEMSELHTKITRINDEIEFLKKKILHLQTDNTTLGERQEELAKHYGKIVLSLNHAMKEKATTTIYINETYTKINWEKKELELQKTYIQEIEGQIERERAEYLKKKEKLNQEIEEYKKLCELKRKETYAKKKELDKLRLTMTKMRETVTTSTVVLSDHNLELARLQESVREWEHKIEEMKKSCKILEDKMLFFKNNREKLDESSNFEKSELLLKIKQMAEKLHKCRLENKALREKLHTVSRQYKIVLNEEDKVFMQKRKIYSEATKEVYRKQIKILNENMERETQRCIITQWKIACLRKKHARWVKNIKDEIKKLIDKIQEAENRRSELIEETSIREHDINEFLAKIEQLTLELKQEEDAFVIKERKLIQELSKFEQRFAEEAQISKEKEVELDKCLPQLQVAEEEFTDKNRKFQNLIETVTAQKNEQNLLNNNISQFTRDFIQYINNTKKVKQELKQLREHESYKTKAHFEILKSLENEIYLHDLKTDALILENKRLKEYIAYLKDNIEQYERGEEDLVRSSSDLSCQLTDLQTQYSDLWAEFWTTLKELIESGNETLREIKNLIGKLCERDEKIEQISILLQSDLDEMRSLMEKESETDFLKKKKKSPVNVIRFPAVKCTMKKTSTKKS
ncbi:coiled-coil domain-containing protein 175 isoform X3 [Bubalus bubalis]|uniref:coiled-coil domain-containing protein 175 isoform X3 n=1 Tax=Bubalus bubalis TaxID=89462 RepID=UPI001D0FCEEC|nr:coiled-coil domain-containing protein 175 isoform X3 [Bubalus bubalis]